MPRAVSRLILWGTMAVDGGKRRRYLFRVDPEGLVAVRVGNPLSFTTLFLVVYFFFVFLWDRFGPPSLLAAGALGMLLVGLLDNAIARGVAGQPREAVLKSRMNSFVPVDAIREGDFEESQSLTYLRVRDQNRIFRIAIRRPPPPDARSILDRQWAMG